MRKPTSRRVPTAKRPVRSPVTSVPVVTPIEFQSGGCKVRGQFYSARSRLLRPTLLLLPGWPGNPTDVLGLGSLIARRGIHMMMFNPRGMHQSEGIATFPNTLADIRAALAWLRDASIARRFRVDTSCIALGGHSYGGGMALAYAAQDPTIRRVVSCAGNDHAEFIRETQRNAELAREFQVWHRQSMAPQGPVRFHFETDMQELAEHQDVYGLRENAERLSGRSILICGGWEDPFVTVDQYLLPFYRALKKAGAQDVRFLVYHSDHRFDGVRELVADEIANWVLKAHHAAAAQSPLAE